MKTCPYCNAKIKGSPKFCTECGARLPEDSGSSLNHESALLATDAVFASGAQLRQARLAAAVSPDEIISSRAYNGVIAGILLWGLLINVLLCTYAYRFVMQISPVLFMLLYLVCCFAGIRIAARSNNPGISFLGYNMVVVPFGLMIAVFVQDYGGIGAAVVRDAFVYTMLITLGMTAVVIIAPSLFEKLGGALFGCLLGLFLCEIVLLIFRVDQYVTDWLLAGLFSMYIGYDIHRAQQFPKTVDNAVDSALDIYLDIANLFIRLLSILGRRDKK